MLLGQKVVAEAGRRVMVRVVLVMLLLLMLMVLLRVMRVMTHETCRAGIIKLLLCRVLLMTRMMVQV